MLLTISQEISSIAQSAEGAVDLITNTRTIDTTVIVDDGEILVLGGLLEDTLRESDQRVPVLGSIPILGNLFRSRKTDKVKTNLYVFIRPKILRDAEAAALETNAKYTQIREIMMGKDGNVQLMPRARRPVLPSLDGESETDDASDGDDEQ